MCEKKRSGGYEAGGLRRRGRVTAWSQARRRGQRQLRDAGDARGALSPFVTPGRPSSAKKKDAPSFPCAGLHSHGFHLPSPSSFLNFLRDYRCCISSSYNQTISVPSPHHSASFLYSPLWLCASDPLNCFSLSILKVCLLPMISQSLTHSFCSTLHSLIWFTQLPPPSVLLSAPFLSPCRITLDIYSTAIRRKGRQLAGL